MGLLARIRIRRTRCWSEVHPVLNLQFVHSPDLAIVLNMSRTVVVKLMHDPGTVIHISPSANTHIYQKHGLCAECVADYLHRFWFPNLDTVGADAGNVGYQMPLTGCTLVVVVKLKRDGVFSLKTLYGSKEYDAIHINDLCHDRCYSIYGDRSGPHAHHVYHGKERK